MRFSYFITQYFSFSGHSVHVSMPSIQSMKATELLHIMILLDHVICKPRWFLFQGKGLRNTYWIYGRKGLSLPLLQMDAGGDETAIDVQTIDDWLKPPGEREMWL